MEIEFLQRELNKFQPIFSAEYGSFSAFSWELGMGEKLFNFYENHVVGLKHFG